MIRTGSRLTGRYVPGERDGTLNILEDKLGTGCPGCSMGLRVALNILGEGYIEAVPDQEFRSIAVAQVKETHGKIRGQPTRVTLLERTKSFKGVGHFGWKAQHGSLLSASADAFHSELGMPNKYYPATSVRCSERSKNGSAADMEKLNEMVRFLRASEPIGPDPELNVTESARAGSQIFDRVGCSICHVRTLKTAPAGSKMMGDTMIVSERLGNKEIHPFSDYLLHDIGTGDGVIQNIRPQDYDEDSANKFRTAPLWGVRFRSWLMHDGKSVTYHQAIMRHSGEASDVVKRYEQLTPIEKQDLRQFLDSL